jgi:threonine/homoserine/homoserine lactone efflux protein
VLAGLAAANLAASVAPGPNVALVVGASARGGARAGLAACAGVLVAETIWALCALLAIGGLAARIDPAPLRQAGGATLIGLGLWSLAQRPGGMVAAARPRLGALLGQGVLVGLANPVALVFFAAVFPPLVGDATLTPGVCALCVAAVALSSAAGLAPWLAGSAWLIPPGRVLALHRACAVAIVACGAMALASPAG